MARKNHKPKPAKTNVRAKAKLMDTLGNQVPNNKKLKIPSRTPDSNYA